MKNSIDKSFEDGKAVGELKGKIETAKNMIKKGFDNILINEITGLSMDKITSLRTSSNEDIRKKTIT